MCRHVVKSYGGTSRLNPWNDVRYEVGVYPVDDAGVDISHLEQRWNFGVPGTAIHPDHISHAPGTFRVSDDHGHAWFDVQENGIRLGRCNGACMINRHTTFTSTAVLVQTGGLGNRGCLKKRGGFGRPFKWQAHFDPAGVRDLPAAGSRGPLGLLPHKWGVEVH